MMTAKQIKALEKLDKDMDNPETKPPVAGEAAGSASGPRYCAVCGEWPAMETPLGLRCHLCECRDYAAAHPVPLPNNPEMLRDLASIGVPGAAEKLSRMPNDQAEPSGSARKEK